MDFINIIIIIYNYIYILKSCTNNSIKKIKQVLHHKLDIGLQFIRTESNKYTLLTKKILEAIL